MTERQAVIRSREQLSDVLLGNNPSPTAKTGWTRRSGRTYDLLTWDYDWGSWSIACNKERISLGTIGWIYRSDGSFGHLAGLIVFGEETSDEGRGARRVYYRSGWLWRLPREWWVDGARIAAHPDWAGRAPFGAVRRFRNGEELRSRHREIVWQHLHPIAQEWVERTVQDMRASA